MHLGKDHGVLSEIILRTLPKLGTCKIGVAVSGGGDSVALLNLLAKNRDTFGYSLEAVTVDHGLRVDSAEEADFVQMMCRDLSVPHAVACWTGWNGEGNLQNEARLARYRLIAEWAKRRGLSYVCLGHTENDVAETFLMRLGRESGVDGLARMSSDFERSGCRFLRPMLEISRSSLRKYLLESRIEWCEDPSNNNDAFERVRARRAIKALNECGFLASNLAVVSKNMTDARTALCKLTVETSADIVSQRHGDLIVHKQQFLSLDPEIQRRILVNILNWVSNTEYPSRRTAISELLLAIEAGRNFSLSGCMIFVGHSEIRFSREFNVVRDLVEHSRQWDRWILSGPWQVGMSIKALGEPSLAGLKDWRALEIPHQTLMASPAIWLDNNLIAVPMANFGTGWKAELQSGDFHKKINA